MLRRQTWLAAPKSYNVTLKAFMTFAVSAAPVRARPDEDVETHRVEFELWGKKCPMAVENFARCCVGDMVLDGVPASEGIEEPMWRDTLKPQLTYRETTLHRVEPGFAIVGGDVSMGKPELGTVSVFGPDFDAPEELAQQSFDAKGLLGTAVSAPHKNHSQFFVLLDPAGAPHLDNTCICFGRVTKGLDFLERVAAGRLNGELAPRVPVRVVDCGVA